MKHVELPEANRKVCEALANRLLATFEEFANEMVQKDPEGLRYLDGMMGVHNFYKAILINLYEKSGQPLWFEAAVATLACTLEEYLEKHGKHTRN